MARLVEQLTEAKIRNIRAPGLYADGRGLYLQVRDGGARSWIFRFTLNGRTRDKGMGALAEVGLVAARTKAAEYRALQAKGIDPIDHAKAERAAAAVPIAGSGGPTFREAAEKYMAEKLTRLRSEVHRQQWRYSLETFAYPIIGDMPVAAIRTPDVLSVLRPIWETRCETAMRLRGRIERVLARAAVQGHRSGDNPAQWRGHLKEELPKRSEVSPVVHFPAMKFAEVPAFMAELRVR
ncbi:MAG: Arm DNA-binding domain-containing protein, partial [Pseudomonadota bacterium]|nr:Arm DNA-binding domain-containing protein [Pseudomonadota bacterium]